MINATRLVALRTDHAQSAELADLLRVLRSRRITTKDNVHATSSHVRGDRHRARSPSLRDNFSFFFVVLRVQNHMRHASLRKQHAQNLVLLNRRGAKQNRLSFFMTLFDFTHDGLKFPHLRFVHAICQICSRIFLVRWNLRDLEFVNR